MGKEASIRWACPPPQALSPGASLRCHVLFLEQTQEIACYCFSTFKKEETVIRVKELV